MLNMLMTKKRIVSLAIACLVIANPIGCLAAGLGVVDMSYLEQRHMNYEQAVPTLANFAKQCNTLFAKQSHGKTTDAKKDLQLYYQKQVDDKRVSLFTPIDEDIQIRIKRVKDVRNLDYVVQKGSVIFGNYVDITQDVLKAMTGTY